MTAAPLLTGLASNPAAPVEVLLRLLDTHADRARTGLLRRQELPRPVQDAMLRHPSSSIRFALANHRDVDPEIRATLLADPHWRVRMGAFGAAGQRPLSDEALEHLLGEIVDPTLDWMMTREELIGEFLHDKFLDHRVLRLIARHPLPAVRQIAGGLLNLLDEPDRQALLTDEAPEVQQAAADQVAYRQQVMEPADLPTQHSHGFWWVLQRPLSRALVDHVAASGDLRALAIVAGNPTTPPDVVETLVRHPDPGVRRGAAGHPGLTGSQLVALAADPAVEVRTAVSVHPGLTEKQRAGIDIEVTPVDEGDDVGVPGAGDPRSVNPFLRRRAARDPELPAELVAILADDPDPGVRLLLARHHRAAPPVLLLRVYLEYDGPGRDRIAQRPQFPIDGLARFADDPDPAVRWLVSLDPQADPALVDRLTGDPDSTVRHAMASCPRLPTARIVELLGHPDLSEAAAANPALPFDRMRQILLVSTPASGDGGGRRR